MAHIDQTRHIVYRKMETVEETDNITKNIVREIVRECKAKDKILDENFCIYFVKLLLLDPKWGISPESQLNREKVSFFVTYCVQQLQGDEAPYISTLMSQHMFMSKAHSKADMVADQRMEVYEKLEPLKTEIYDFELEERNKQQEQRLYKKIVIYIIVLSGLGNPSDANVLKEATVALQSVFDEEDIYKFTQLSCVEKEEQIQYLNNVVAGIRIYNMKSGKNCSGVSDLSKAIKESIDVTKVEVQKYLVRIMEKVNIITSVIGKCFKLEKHIEGGFKLVKNHPEYDPKYLRMLVAFRQQELYIRKILMETESVAKHTEKICEEKLQEIIVKLNKIVKFKVAIPIHQVFPLFYEIAEWGFKMQDQAIIMAKYDKIFLKLHKLGQKVEIDLPYFMELIGNDPILTDAKRLENTMGFKIDPHFNKCKVLDIEEVNLKHHSLEYLGFCPWSIVETDGGLIPGNPNMGICKWKNKLYVFSSLEAANSFGRNPDRYIMGVLDVARRKTELIHFLQLYPRLLGLRDVAILYEKPPKVLLTKTQSMQTELHPIKSNIDHSYRWNIWEQLRDAIRWANISEYRTHSTQTYQSHWRSPARVQTYELRHTGSQTKRDNYTNIPTLSNFLFGLRGRTDDIQHMIELTRPVDE